MLLNTQTRNDLQKAVDASGGENVLAEIFRKLLIFKELIVRRIWPIRNLGTSPPLFLHVQANRGIAGVHRKASNKIKESVAKYFAEHPTRLDSRYINRLSLGKSDKNKKSKFRTRLPIDLGRLTLHPLRQSDTSLPLGRIQCLQYTRYFRWMEH